MEKSINYYEDILQFCLTSDVYNRLGMSLFDIMKLDLVSYKKLRDMLKTVPRSESKELKDVIDKFKL